MWVRIGTFLVKDGAGEALSSTYHERATPLVRATPGNRGALLLQPVQPGEPFAGRRSFMGETDLETVRMVQQARVPSIRQFNPKVWGYEDQTV